MRPPPPASPASAYVTREGYLRLRAEYDHLWRERRPEVVRALSAAAAEGDRSENAEYIYRKKELREVDRRVRYLQRRLAEFKVVDTRPADSSKVFFGARVGILDDRQLTRTVRLVGADEVESSSGRISIDSPMARALLRHAVGDVVTVVLPSRVETVEILSIEY